MTSYLLTMPLFSKLPFVVVQHIIRIAAGDELNDYMYWKYSLPFLAICHSWREFGIPIIYKNVYLASSSVRGQGFNYSNGTGYTQTTAGYTNVGLYQSTGMSTHAKQLLLEFDYPQYLHFFINDFAAMFVTDNSDWTHITKLELKLDYSDGDGDNNYTGPVLNSSEIDEFIDKIYAVIPNIRKIIIKGDGNNFTKYFEKSLVSKYLDKLKYIDCNNYDIMSLINPANTKSTSSMTINGSDELNHKYPQDVTSKLTSLTITNFKSNSIWNRFQGSSNHELVFPHLNELFFDSVKSEHADQDNAIVQSFNFSDSTYPQDNTFKVSFPKLKDLVVDFDNWEAVHNLFFSGVYDLSNVSVLFPYKTSLFDSDNSSNQPNLSNMAKRLAHSIALLMPNLEHVYAPYQFVRNVDNLLMNNLAIKLYSRLETFDIRCPLQLESVLYLPKITMLVLNYSLEGTGNMVQYCADTIALLSLRELPNYFTLNTLNSGSLNNQTVIYSKLSTMRLRFKGKEYDSDSDVEIFSKQVNQEPMECTCKFPALGWMDVECNKFSNLYNLFGYKNHVCPLVTNLTIDYNGIDDDDGDDDDNNNVGIKPNKKLARALESLANIIFASFPHVENLVSAMNTSTINYLPKLHEKLMGLYCHQLKCVCTVVPVDWHNITLSREMTNLHITYLKNDSDNKLTSDQTTVDNNDEVVLVENNYIRKTFQLDNSDNMVILDKMIEFKLEFQEPNCLHNQSTKKFKACSGSSPPIKVYLPKSKSIAISAGYKYCEMGNTELYFGYGANLMLSGPAILLPLCGNKNSYIDYIDITLEQVATEDESHFYNFTNNWLGPSNFVDYSHLFLDALPINFCPSKLNWPKLYKLTIDGEVEMTIGLEIIKQLVNLSSIHLYNVTVSQQPSQVQAYIKSKETDDLIVDMLSESIKYLKIYYSSETNTMETLSPYFEYLTLATPSLKEYEYGEDSEFNLDALIEKYGEKFPHLVNVSEFDNESDTD